MAESNEDLQQLVDDCVARERKLSSWDHDFLDSIQKRLDLNQPLTEKQVAALNAIWDRATA